jgi:flavin-dependent dehydrogenase
MDPERYDAVVIGGAFSGAAFATLLKRWRPTSRVLVVEQRPAFDRKVGEATVEISSLMLSRALGLHDYLAREQLPKHGLRYWFSDSPQRSLAEMSEVGPSEVPRLPTFQLDRARMDEKLLSLAAAAGAEVARPARVVDVDLDWPESRLTVEDGDRRQVAARWVVDASGRHALLARRLHLLRLTEEHPTAAAWGRWRGVRDFDGPEVLGVDPGQPRLPPIPPARRLATNHFCGYGWWCWMIPLAGGETSVGLVWDRRLFHWPAEGPLIDRYRAFLAGSPGLRELLDGAVLDEEDFRSYAHLPYCASRYMDRGWALLGDAASFLDPYYSPGLDHASISAYATARLVEEDLDGRLGDAGLEAAVAEHNRRFLLSYRRWLAALYVDKYELFGDAELTGAAFMLDTAMYYMGVVTPAHADLEELRQPLFAQPIPQATAAFRLMRFYHRRLVALARRRRRLGTYGRRNAGWRCLVPTAGLGVGSGSGLFARGVRLWLRAEIETLTDLIRRGDEEPAEARRPEAAGEARA